MAWDSSRGCYLQCYNEGCTVIVRNIFAYCSDACAAAARGISEAEFVANREAVHRAQDQRWAEEKRIAIASDAARQAKLNREHPGCRFCTNGIDSRGEGCASCETAEFRRRISDAYDAHQRAIDREEERDRRRDRRRGR